MGMNVGITEYSLAIITTNVFSPNDSKGVPVLSVMYRKEALLLSTSSKYAQR
mgnify:CR=1 FL=1